MTNGRHTCQVHKPCTVVLPSHPIAFSDTFSLAQPRPTMSAGIFHSAEHYSKYDKDSEDQNVFAFLSPSTTMVNARPGADQPALPQPGDDEQQGAHPMTIATANDAFPSPTFDPYTRFPAESLYSAPLPLSQSQSLPQVLPSTTSHSSNAENEPYKCGSNTTPTAVSSNEARVSLPSHEGSGEEPRSSPVTGAEECIVSVPISATGNTGCYSSEDMDRTALEGVEVKTPPSDDRYIGFLG
jgi:hypothetical protein